MALALAAALTAAACSGGESALDAGDDDTESFEEWSDEVARLAARELPGGVYLASALRGNENWASSLDPPEKPIQTDTETEDEYEMRFLVWECEREESAKAKESASKGNKQLFSILLEDCHEQLRTEVMAASGFGAAKSLNRPRMEWRCTS